MKISMDLQNKVIIGVFAYLMCNNDWLEEYGMGIGVNSSRSSKLVKVN